MSSDGSCQILSKHADPDLRGSGTKYRYVLDIFILFLAFFVLASVRNDTGIVLASALFALSAITSDSSAERIAKLRKILEYVKAKTNSGVYQIEIKMRPKKPSKRNYVYRYILYFVTNVAIWEIVLRAMGWVR